MSKGGKAGAKSGMRKTGASGGDDATRRQKFEARRLDGSVAARFTAAGHKAALTRVRNHHLVTGHRYTVHNSAGKHVGDV